MVVLVVDYHHTDVEDHQDPVDGEVEGEENVRDEKLAQGASQVVRAYEGMEKPFFLFLDFFCQFVNFKS